MTEIPNMDIAEKRRKADAGNCAAQSILGLSYLYGNEVEVNYHEAFKYLSAAADQGGSRATLNLGLMYAKGLGIPQDIPEAIRLLEAVAKPSDSSDAFAARIELGRLYSSNPEVHADAGKALDWYEAAITLVNDDEDSQEIREAKDYVSGHKTMPVPTEADWGNNHDDLDQEYAHKLFAGRTNEEMLPHFHRNVIERTDELRWMPEIPFRYYMLGFRDFVMAGDFQQLKASDAASCFLGLVLEKLGKQPAEILPIMLQLLPAIRHVATNQASFEADENIYGNFKEQLKRIE